MSGESQVTGSSINVNYPIPGQNNSTQGFRDNFTAIRAALNRTGVELTQLRQNAVLKNTVEGIPAIANDFAYSRLSKTQLCSQTETFYDLGTQLGTFYVDFNNGNFQKVTIFRDCSPAFVNIPRGDQVGTIKIWFSVQNPNLVCTLPKTVSYGTTNSFTTANKITFPARGDYLLVFNSVDNGRKFFMYPLSGLTDYRNLPSGTSSSTGTGSGSSLTSSDITSLPIASVSEFGIVKVDGTTIGIFDGVLSVIGGIPVAVSSDARLKTNVETITDSLSSNRRLRGVSFNYIESDQASIGVIAQETEPVLPELVSEGADGFKRVNYAAMAGLFIECIKDLEDQIQQLRQEIAQLRG